MLHLAAPLGGLNTRDPIANMEPQYAPVLDNWFPRPAELTQRGGTSVFASAMTGTVKSLAKYLPTSGTNKLYGVTDAGIYDITAGGVIGAVVQALTNGYWNSLVLTNSAGTTFLWGANGTDTPKMFDGATWSTPTITAVSEGNANIVWPFLWKHRIMFLVNSSQNLYFLPVDSIQGAASPYPMGNLMRGGGYLVSGCAWTLDSGDGPDDLLVLITSEGQIIIFSGTDPSSPTAFSLVGVWTVGRPMGRRCFIPFGGDVIVLTENGVFPLSRILKSGNINYASALSNKIQPSFVAATSASTTTTQGWEGCVYPANDALIINAIPPITSTAQQFVMNTITGAWCTFSGWTPYCFLVFNGALYQGNALGTVALTWGTITSDLGNDITTLLHHAWTDFGSVDTTKQIALFRILLAFSGSIDTKWAVSADFDAPPLKSILTRAFSTPGGVWDVSPWDTSSWASGQTPRNKAWRGVAHSPGYQLALWLQTAGNNGTLSLAGTDYILQRGGIGL